MSKNLGPSPPSSPLLRRQQPLFLSLLFPSSFHPCFLSLSLSSSSLCIFPREHFQFWHSVLRTEEEEEEKGRRIQKWVGGLSPPMLSRILPISKERFFLFLPLLSPSFLGSSMAGDDKYPQQPRFCWHAPKKKERNVSWRNSRRIRRRR